MNINFVTQLLALAALIFAVGAFALRWRSTQRRPSPIDRAVAKGSPGRGVLYAFTLGMAPWAKESTRRHFVAYMRGICFHVGVFAALGALLVSPWWSLLPQPIVWLLALLSGFGAVCGFMGEAMRWVERNLRALSTPDDHGAVWLVSLFLIATTVALLNAAWLPAMYVTSAVMLVYAPLSKIRHCIYFFFSRRFFGLFIGKRAVVHAEVRK